MKDLSEEATFVRTKKYGNETVNWFRANDTTAEQEQDILRKLKKSLIRVCYGNGG